MHALCQMEDLSPGQGCVAEAAGRDGPLRLVLFLTPAGVRAYRNQCPHQGRSLDFAPGEFLLDADQQLVCPHHGATFELQHGLCLAGPCRGEALIPVAVEVHDGAVWLAGSG